MVPVAKAIGHLSLDNSTTFSYLAKVILATVKLSDSVLKECCGQVTQEIKSLCSTNHPSCLRKKSKEDLQLFTWDILVSELQTKCPIFWQLLESATNNPNAKDNKVKTPSHIEKATCSAGAKLISIFNDDMCAIRHLNSIMLKKSGLKKIGFLRLCATYDAMCYNTTNTIQENFGKEHDEQVLIWKKEIEEEHAYEEKLMNEIKILQLAVIPGDPSSNLILEDRKNALKDYKKTLHPGKYYTSSIVIITCTYYKNL